MIKAKTIAKNEANEPTNENGFTREQYFHKLGKIGLQTTAGVFLVSAGAIGNMIYQVNRPINVPQPAGYETFVAANNALTEISQVREKVVSLNGFELRDLPYRTDRLDSVLGTGGFDLFNEPQLVKKLEDAITIINLDIESMKTANPEFVDFPGKVAALENRYRMYYGLGASLAISMGSFLPLIYSAGRRAEKLGSQLFLTPEQANQSPYERLQ